MNLPLRFASCPDVLPHATSRRLAWPAVVGWLALLLVAVVLAGCAGRAAYREANTLFEEGMLEPELAQLEEAVKLDPPNPQHRIALATRRASLVSQSLSAGETARRDGRLDDAERAYRQVLALDPNHAMAK